MNNDPAFQAMVESLGTLLGMGAGAAESELAMREEQFKVLRDWTYDLGIPWICPDIEPAK